MRIVPINKADDTARLSFAEGSKVIVSAIYTLKSLVIDDFKLKTLSNSRLVYLMKAAVKTMEVSNLRATNTLLSTIQEDNDPSSVSYPILEKIISCFPEQIDYIAKARELLKVIPDKPITKDLIGYLESFIDKYTISMHEPTEDEQLINEMFNCVNLINFKSYTAEEQEDHRAILDKYVEFICAIYGPLSIKAGAYD